MIIDVGYWTRIVKNIIMLTLSVLLMILAIKLTIFYMPFLIGFIISLLIDPLIKMITKRTNIERKKIAIIVLIVIFGVLLGLLAWGIVSLITESTNLMQVFNEYIENTYSRIEEYIQRIREGNSRIPSQVVTILEKSTDTIIDFTTRFLDTFLNKVTQIISKIPVIGIYIIITILATYFICTDRMYIIDAIESQIPNKWARKLGAHLRDIVKELGHYLKAEVILIMISFFTVLVSLVTLRFWGYNIQYPFLSALRNRLCRCSAYLGGRNCYDTLGYN